MCLFHWRELSNLASQKLLGDTTDQNEISRQCKTSSKNNEDIFSIPESFAAHIHQMILLKLCSYPTPMQLCYRYINPLQLNAMHCTSSSLCSSLQWSMNKVLVLLFCVGRPYKTCLLGLLEVTDCIIEFNGTMHNLKESALWCIQIQVQGPFIFDINKIILIS